MDVSEIVNWGTIGIWTVAFILYLGRLVRGEAAMPPRIRRFLSSGALIPVVIALGLIGSVASGIVHYKENHESELEDVTITAYPQPATGNTTMDIIRDKTFENDTVPIDGHIFVNCTFINACLLYNGGPYELQHATFKHSWTVCTGNYGFASYSELMYVLHKMRPSVQKLQKNIVKQNPGVH